MKETLTNVVVHIAEIASGADATSIERMLAAEHGVAGARMSPHARSLALVAYDPTVISATAIQRFIQAKGFTARLAGM